MKPERDKLWNSDKCRKCASRLLLLYYRENGEDQRSWVKTQYKYCKDCKQIQRER